MLSFDKIYRGNRHHIMYKYTVKNNKYTAKTRKYSVRLEEAKVNLLKEHYGEESFTKIIESIIDERIENILPPPKKVKSPILRIGGKSLVADKLVELMPENRIWVDVFGGAAHLLFAKEPDMSRIEVLNDKCGDIMNLFEIIRDKPLELREKILEMPCSRAYYNKLKSLPMPQDNVERAAVYFYLVRNSFYGDIRSGWRAPSKLNPAKTIQRISDELYWMSQRLKNVTMECMDWKYILRKYGKYEDTFLFVDPPYIIYGKKHGIYELPFTVDDNRDLAKRLKELPCKVMVTHYPNKLFDRYYKGWRVEQIETYKGSGALVERQETDEQGNIITVKEKPKVIENVYMNY